MKFGFTGSILHVDLTTNKLEVEHPEQAFYRKYMGGSLLGAYYVLRNTPPGIDPFGPENTLAFALSGLTGAPISGQSRMTTVAKSPLTDAIGDSQSGGFFPAEMKFSGFDAVVIRGQSERPVYLWLHDGEAELRSAEHLWGKITGEVETIIRDELGDSKIEVAQCGPAGERLVRFAGVINMSNRANGRTGIGAVMGSKNLKAVAVRGTERIEVANRENLLELAKWGAENLEESDIYSLSLLGTARIIASQNADGGLPTRNWISGAFEGWESIDGKTIEDTTNRTRDTCYACTVRCKPVVEIKDGPYRVDPHYGGPEYETLATLGSLCGIDNLAAVSFANQRCNMVGMDTISCGATIAWAMDCFEQGMITKKETDGIELRFGNAEAMVQLVDMIARREGIGDLLAEGSSRAAATLGRGSEDLVVAVKKQEYPAHMPQVKRSLALIYAVNPFGPDHQSHAHDPTYHDYAERMSQLGLKNPQHVMVLNEEKIRSALQTQYIYSCLDTINLCHFVFGPAFQLYGPDQIVEAVQAITGWDVSLDELMEVGARRLNILRAFNAREGIDRSEDTLPKKLQKALVGGVSAGLFIKEEEVESAKDLYYAMAGWDVATGIPTRSRLEELDLKWIADSMKI